MKRAWNEFPNKNQVGTGSRVFCVVRHRLLPVCLSVWRCTQGAALGSHIEESCFAPLSPSPGTLHDHSWSKHFLCKAFLWAVHRAQHCAFSPGKGKWTLGRVTRWRATGSVSAELRPDVCTLFCVMCAAWLTLGFTGVKVRGRSSALFLTRKPVLQLTKSMAFSCSLNLPLTAKVKPKRQTWSCHLEVEWGTENPERHITGVTYAPLPPGPLRLLAGPWPAELVWRS